MTSARVPRLARALASALPLLASILLGCGDRAPPALWPEPPPPSLAAPIGVSHERRAPDREAKRDDAPRDLDEPRATGSDASSPGTETPSPSGDSEGDSGSVGGDAAPPDDPRSGAVRPPRP